MMPELCDHKIMIMKASELQKEYKSYLVFRNYRPHTIKANTKIIQHFFVYCQTAKKINQSLQSKIPSKSKHLL